MPPALTEPPPDFMRWQSISSLVGARHTKSRVASVTSQNQCREAIAFCRRNGLKLCPRGVGHSYGDASLNDGQVILDTTKMNRIIAFDADAGHIDVEPGVSFADVFDRAHRHLLTLPASPTESSITIAGAISANVNGKDGWRAGNFCDQVVHLKLLTAAGELITIDRKTDASLFAAVGGGMGLLGVIVEARLQLQPIPSPMLETSRVPAANLDALLAQLKDLEATSDFIVVWIDAYATDDKLGRAVIHATRWLERPAAPDHLHHEISTALGLLARKSRRADRFQCVLKYPISLMLQAQRTTVRLFNKAYYAFSKPGTKNELFISYNFDPSFTKPAASTVCGPHGYTLQLTVPRTDARKAMTQLLEICHAAPCPPVTTVLRAHRSDDQLLSFCADGYSLNFEFHPKRRHETAMQRTLDKLVQCTADYGGKVHLAKEMFLSPKQFRRLYPGFEALLEVKRRIDPDGLFSSDMYRRLLAVEAAAQAPSV
jgi:decaprenylphospho-beta-D-ribofuranose 2-oxidase